MNDYEDCDGDDVIMVPISSVKCCGRWEGDVKVYDPLVYVERHEGFWVWQCPVCKGCY